MTNLFRQTALSVAMHHPVDPALKQTCVVTGASSGIGLACAVALAKAGWRVICAVRSVPKMEQQIKKRVTSNISPGQLDVMELDLASFDSVKRFATALLARQDVPRIHVLLLNAGILPSWSVTKDGYESGVQTCHISHQLLARLLEEKMIASAPSRIIVVSSIMHKNGRAKYDWPREDHKGFKSDSSKDFAIVSQYAQNKLANLHFSLILGERLREKGVFCVSLHPGVVNSSIWPWWMVGRSLFLLNNEQGAATSAFLASDPKFGSSFKDVGTYWAPSRFGLPHQETPSKAARDHVVAERLWMETEKIISGYL